jgi:hypothetical protein
LFDNPSLTDLTTPFGNLQVDIVTNLKFFYKDLLGLDPSTWTVRQPICPQQVSGQSMALLIAFIAGQWKLLLSVHFPIPSRASK